MVENLISYLTSSNESKKKTLFCQKNCHFSVGKKMSLFSAKTHNHYFYLPIIILWCRKRPHRLNSLLRASELLLKL